METTRIGASSVQAQHLGPVTSQERIQTLVDANEGKLHHRRFGTVLVLGRDDRFSVVRVTPSAIDYSKPAMEASFANGYALGELFKDLSTRADGAERRRAASEAVQRAASERGTNSTTYVVVGAAAGQAMLWRQAGAGRDPFDRVYLSAALTGGKATVTFTRTGV